MLVLGIETSCDETAVAVVSDAAPRIRANLVLSQLAEHRPFGGVVPEIAARAHLDHLDRLIAQALDEAGVGFDALDAVAATGGPGLIGGVMVGVTEAKAIALVRRLPFIAINHLEGHALSVRLESEVAFPYLLLLVSGGHCQLLVVEGVGRYRRLGTTIDDAAGEAFDKGAKLLGLDYPGGPAVERAAQEGDAARFPLPRPMVGRKGCDFSFSGLKTALAQRAAHCAKGGALTARDRADLAASLQAAISASLLDRTRNAVSLAGERGADARRGGRRRRQYDAARPARLARARGRVGVRRAAAGALHRQWRDDRVGRDRAAEARPHRSARFRAAAALAARSGRGAGDRRRRQGVTSASVINS